MQKFPSKVLNVRTGLILLFIIIYLLPLNLRQLGVPDEMRYGEIAREMTASGNYISPRLNGLHYFEKPAGGHILNAVSLKLFGETNFAVRLMPALFAGIAAWALYLLMRRKYSAETAALGTLILLTCAEFMGIGTYSVLDSIVTGFITLTLCFFYPAVETRGLARVGWLILAGLAAGGAFLIKGFIAFAVPVVVIVPYLLLRKRWKDLLILPWIPLISAVIISLPWSLAIAEQEPDFWRYFFWEEHINRFFSQTHAQHENPFWYFIPVILAGTIPWVFTAPLPLRDLIRKRRTEPMILFALCWLIMPFLFFSASSGKLGTYILPCFPGFALLLAVALGDRMEQDRENRSIRTGIYCFGTLLLMTLIGVAVAAILNAMGRMPELDAHITLKFIGALLGLSGAIAALVIALRSNSAYRKTVLLGLSSGILFVTAISCAPTEISPALGIQGFLASEQARIDDNTILVGTPKTTHAMCYVYKRDDVYLFSGMGEFDYGLSYPEAAYRHLDPIELEKLILDRGSRQVVVCIKAKPGSPIKAQLPKPAYEHQWLKIWFAVYEPQTTTPKAR
ncbi:MAG: phospholipid carrier-dependent glycosyltransferase [Pontiellaceae bacterium]|nr:phospholipid carrier-dependent glycosyltransferase [Pontiellaceae bacterium]MBN2785493.1 phospholipid carrier-dependent glycosyltransferase [Pontiellaceae bacterium]